MVPGKLTTAAQIGLLTPFSRAPSPHLVIVPLSFLRSILLPSQTRALGFVFYVLNTMPLVPHLYFSILLRDVKTTTSSQSSYAYVIFLGSL